MSVKKWNIPGIIAICCIIVGTALSVYAEPVIFEDRRLYFFLNKVAHSFYLAAAVIGGVALRLPGRGRGLAMAAVSISLFLLLETMIYIGLAYISYGF